MQTLEIKIERNELTCVIPLDWIDLKPRSRSEAKSARIATGFYGGRVKKLPGDVE